MKTILRSVVKVVSTLFKNAFYNKIQEMYERAVEEDPHILFNVPDQYRTQDMCNEAINMSMVSDI